MHDILASALVLCRSLRTLKLACSVDAVPVYNFFVMCAFHESAVPKLDLYLLGSKDRWADLLVCFKPMQLCLHACLMRIALVLCECAVVLYH